MYIPACPWRCSPSSAAAVRGQHCHVRVELLTSARTPGSAALICHRPGIVPGWSDCKLGSEQSGTQWNPCQSSWEHECAVDSLGSLRICFWTVGGRQVLSRGNHLIRGNHFSVQGCQEVDKGSRPFKRSQRVPSLERAYLRIHWGDKQGLLPFNSPQP